MSWFPVAPPFKLPEGTAQSVAATVTITTGQLRGAYTAVYASPLHGVAVAARRADGGVRAPA